MLLSITAFYFLFNTDEYGVASVFAISICKETTSFCLFNPVVFCIKNPYLIQQLTNTHRLLFVR